MVTTARLEHRAEMEFEKLGVAEDLAWWLGGFVALSAFLKWENWLITGAAFTVAYLATILPYKKRHAAAKSAADTASQVSEADDAV